MRCNITAGIITAVFVTMMVIFSSYCDQLDLPDKEWEHLLYLPKSNLLKILSFGHQETIADYLWIKTVLYLGRYHDIAEKLASGHREYHDKNNKHEHHHNGSERIFKQNIHTMLDKILYSKLGKNYLIHLSPLLNTITDLNPYFIKPYEIAGYILPMETGEVKEGLRLIKKGIKYNPDNWQLYFWEGFIYLFYYDDYLKAIESFKIASRKPDCPSYVIKSLVALYQATDRTEMGIHFFEILVEQTEDEKLKKQILEVLDLLKQKK